MKDKNGQKIHCKIKELDFFMVKSITAGVVMQFSPIVATPENLLHVYSNLFPRGKTL